MSNSAERLRAYLDARYAAADAAGRKMRPRQPVIDSEFDHSSRKYVSLREADLETLLQTLQLITEVAKVQAERNPPMVTVPVSLAEAWDKGWDARKQYDRGDGAITNPYRDNR